MKKNKAELKSIINFLLLFRLIYQFFSVAIIRRKTDAFKLSINVYIL